MLWRLRVPKHQLAAVGSREDGGGERACGGGGVVVLKNGGGGGYPLHSLGTNISSEFLLGIVELHLDLPEPVLENGDETHAPIHGVTETRLCFISQGLNGVVSLRSVELVEKLGHVAGTENLVHVREPLRVVRWKIRCKYAFLRTLPP